MIFLLIWWKAKSNWAKTSGAKVSTTPAGISLTYEDQAWQAGWHNEYFTDRT